MAKFNEYPSKATPEDNDTLMIYDAAAKANKLSPFSGIWNWIVGKLTNAVIANLQTNNKTVLGAINELNSNRFKYRTVSFVDVTIPASGYLTYSAMTKKEGTNNVPSSPIFACVRSYGIVTPKVSFTAGIGYIIGQPGTTITSLDVIFVY